MRSIQAFLRKINLYLSESTVYRFAMPPLLILMCGIFFTTAFIAYSSKDTLYYFTYTKNHIEEKVDNRSRKVFGAKSGDVYYYSWCASGDRILEKNRMYFIDTETAQREGRTLAKNCK